MVRSQGALSCSGGPLSRSQSLLSPVHRRKDGRTQWLSWPAAPPPLLWTTWNRVRLVAQQTRACPTIKLPIRARRKFLAAYDMPSTKTSSPGPNETLRHPGRQRMHRDANWRQAGGEASARLRRAGVELASRRCLAGVELAWSLLVRERTLRCYGAVEMRDCLFERAVRSWLLQRAGRDCDVTTAARNGPRRRQSGRSRRPKWCVNGSGSTVSRTLKVPYRVPVSFTPRMTRFKGSAVSRC